MQEHGSDSDVKLQTILTGTHHPHLKTTCSLGTAPQEKTNPGTLGIHKNYEEKPEHSQRE